MRRDLKVKMNQEKVVEVKWEGAVLTQELYEAEAKNKKFIPVVFSFEDVDHIPVVLKGATYYDSIQIRV